MVISNNGSRKLITSVSANQKAVLSATVKARSKPSQKIATAASSAAAEIRPRQNQRVVAATTTASSSVMAVKTRLKCLKLAETSAEVARINQKTTTTALSSVVVVKIRSKCPKVAET